MIEKTCFEHIFLHYIIMQNYKKIYTRDKQNNVFLFFIQIQDDRQDPMT